MPRRSRRPGEPPTDPQTTTPAAPGPASSRGSSAGSTGTNLFGLESAPFEPPDEPDHGQVLGAELEDDGAYEPPAPELIDWTPERAASVIRAGGFLLHTADPLADEQGGEALWRATQGDIETMGPPLARILNRYATARRLAGLSDEGEFAIGMLDYAKRNLATRGRLRVQKKARLEAEQENHGGGLFEGPAAPEAA